jgi:hypothetical protein
MITMPETAWLISGFVPPHYPAQDYYLQVAIVERLGYQMVHRVSFISLPESWYLTI